jgi:hypothetical protein
MCAWFSSRFTDRGFVTPRRAASTVIFPSVAAGSSRGGLDQAGPTARDSRLIAAFTSRSWMVPHSGHHHSRTTGGSLSTTQPEAEPIFRDGKKRSAAITSPPPIRCLSSYCTGNRRKRSPSAAPTCLSVAPRKHVQLLFGQCGPSRVSFASQRQNAIAITSLERFHAVTQIGRSFNRSTSWQPLGCASTTYRRRCALSIQCLLAV